LDVTFVRKLQLCTKMESIKIYQSLSAYGLLSDLRGRVGQMRKWKKAPSRDTVWTTFNEAGVNGKFTPLQSLIFEQGKILLQEHELKIKQVLEPA